MAPTGTQYKKILKEIADNLTFSDVSSLKFVCRGKIGAAALDKIPNREPLKLFKLLEERLFISKDNLTCLRYMLEQIQRIDLMGKIPDEFCQQKQTNSFDAVDSGSMVAGGSPVSADMVPSNVVSPYRVLLKTIADDLTRDSISEMKFLLDVPDGIGEKLHDGQSLFTHLEGIGKLSENNLAELKDILSEVNRKDLTRKIEEFSINEAQPISSFQYGRDPTSCYSMQKPYGFALIINIRTFEGTTDEGYILNERNGSEVDVEKLTCLWEDLGFIVEKYEKLKAHEICTVVTDIVAKINKNRGASCFICCLMTHGAMGKIYGSDSKFVNVKNITDTFKEVNCPALAGKPKLFFIQACRGRQRYTGITPLAATSNTGTPAIEPALTIAESTNATIPPQEQEQAHQTQGLDADAVPAKAATATTAATDEDYNNDMINESTFRQSADPNEPHFLLGYSTAPGYVSIRSVSAGTWYVNALVEIFRQYHATEDVMQMMVRVNGKVSEAYCNQGYKQCPVPVFTLTKSIYF